MEEEGLGTASKLKSRLLKSPIVKKKTMIVDFVSVLKSTPRASGILSLTRDHQPLFFHYREALFQTSRV